MTMKRQFFAGVWCSALAILVGKTLGVGGVLADMLRDGRPEMRPSSIWALRGIGTRAVATLLVNAEKGLDQGQRAAVRNALEAIRKSGAEVRNDRLALAEIKKTLARHLDQDPKIDEAVRRRISSLQRRPPAGSSEPVVLNIESIRLASRSLIAPAATPRYGTCVISTPAIFLNSSPERWIDVPTPEEAKLSLPGLALA